MPEYRVKLIIAKKYERNSVISNRSETARLLLGFNASVGVMDNYGNKALSWMITKMPPVAMEALNQFHTTDRPNRKQYFYLHLLVQDRIRVIKIRKILYVMDLGQAAVTYKQYDLLMHKFQTLSVKIKLKVVACLAESSTKFDLHYSVLAALGFTVWQVVEEILEYKRSLRSHQISKKRREKAINEDLKYCHPRWPEEEAFLRTELEDLDELSPKYFSDFWYVLFLLVTTIDTFFSCTKLLWCCCFLLLSDSSVRSIIFQLDQVHLKMNIFDWVCYTFLLVCIATHFADIISHTEELARQHIRIMAITIILLWIRLFKIARAFSLLGPFIVMLAHMTKDVLRFLFLFFVFYIPFVFINSRNWHHGMKNVDPIMANVLVGFWIALSAILMLNLFIALLVYDNAQANAVMQKAITILSFWEGMSKSSRDKFLDHIHQNCAPLKEYYDDDMTEEGEEDLKKVTIQVKDDLSDSGNGVSVEKFENEIQILREGVTELQVRQDDMMDKFKNDMTTVKNLLLELLGRPGDDGALDSLGMTEKSGRQRSRSKGVKKKKKSSKFLLEDQVAPLTDTPVSVSGVHPGLTSTPMVDVSTADFSAGAVPQLSQQADPIFTGMFPQMSGQDPSEC
ncbi:hypothetical protein KUTeg_016932 [Tegillarca granosa]|uniref:Uncharacterized protein n=1 Tax=Tegillarca granosa TaxID=220873 RepID=A0ABQ9ES46_TEGGR|nr:hypothetical protein KUTeg_016932 [Tegillarca granosa]